MGVGWGGGETERGGEKKRKRRKKKRGRGKKRERATRGREKERSGVYRLVQSHCTIQTHPNPGLSRAESSKLTPEAHARPWKSFLMSYLN